MELPVYSEIKNDESTYFTFSKSFVDFDLARVENRPCYFSKLVALNLPKWEAPNFFIDLNKIGEESDNPNIVLPKVFQYYIENILNQTLSFDTNDIKEKCEIAFFKSLELMGMSQSEIQNSITFVNDLAISNFITIDNNNGWAEIIGQIPNKCNKISITKRKISNILDVVKPLNPITNALYDNDNYEYLFSEDNKKVIDFSNIIYDDVITSSFDFNCLLLFYTDIQSDGTEIIKLHGINFMYPFENNIVDWSLPVFTQKTNVINQIGYQFKFNMKSCNNEATQTLIYELQEHSHWNTFATTLGKLNSFLDVELNKNNVDTLTNKELIEISVAEQINKHNIDEKAHSNIIGDIAEILDDINN